MCRPLAMGTLQDMQSDLINCGIIRTAMVGTIMASQQTVVCTPPPSAKTLLGPPRTSARFSETMVLASCLSAFGSGDWKMMLLKRKLRLWFFGLQQRRHKGHLRATAHEDGQWYVPNCRAHPDWKLCKPGAEPQTWKPKTRPLPSH
jgi:hypothetical protein